MARPPATHAQGLVSQRQSTMATKQLQEGFILLTQRASVALAPGTLVVRRAASRVARHLQRHEDNPPEAQQPPIPREQATHNSTTAQYTHGSYGGYCETKAEKTEKTDARGVGSRGLLEAVEAFISSNGCFTRIPYLQFDVSSPQSWVC